MPSTTSMVTPAEQRSWLYWNQDGLANLVSGTGCLVVAAATIVAVRLTAPELRFPVAALLMVAYAILTLAMRAIVLRLKERLVFPRTGYVAPPYFTDPVPQPSPASEVSLFDDSSRAQAAKARWEGYGRSAVFIVVFLIMAVCLAFLEDPGLCFVAGALTGIAMILAARRVLRLSWAIVLVFPFAGAMMLNQIARGYLRYSAWLVGAGLVFILYGAHRLARYLHANPEPRP